MNATSCRLGALVLLGVLSGCNTYANVAAMYTGCDPDEIVISNRRHGWDTRSWTALCRGVSYECGSMSVGQNVATHCSRPLEVPQVVPSGAVVAPTSVTPATQPRVSAVSREVREGVVYLRAEIVLSSVELHITAAPGHDPASVSFTLAMNGAENQRRACETGVLVDGAIRATHVISYVFDGGVEMLKFIETIDALREMASSTRLSGRVCIEEWRLDEPGRAVLRELIARFDEELAWSRQPVAP